MTERNGWTGMRPLLAATAMAALSGCAATHVGEDWQCPIAQGSVCASVAAADPAVPETGVPGTHRTERPAAETPLYRPAAEGSGERDAGEARAEAACERDCGALAWLRGLFAGIAGVTGAGAGEAEDPGRAEVAAAGDGGEDGDSGPPDDTDTVAAPVAGGAPDAPETETASPLAARETGDGPSDGGLRAPEVIGRVWIAPFVDADGIYREGAWVRVVIEPAAWRLR